MRTAGYFDALAKFVFDEEGRRAKVKRAILDKNMKVSLGTEIGYNLEEDRKKYHVTDSGIVVVEGHHTTVDIATIQV